jgi:serine/threonine-protein kinase
MPEPAPPGPAADRNLLFGILALQMDLISRDGLIEAMHAWVLDKAKPLGQILLAQGSLTTQRLHLLDALVQEHLDAHHGDPQRSLASAAAPVALGPELRGLPDADVQASLASLTTPSDADPEATGPNLPPAYDWAAGGRYRVLRPHAKGGLGEVFVAQDTELAREVALKEIRGEHARDPHSRRRFLREAQITGALEHPGVVPVHGLGFYPDGRPYYAMRLVRGQTLQEAIERFHGADGPGRDVGERRLALRHLLSQFIAICNAVAYAHSRGVLHRDLKPANAILGKYGEALVLDWGLAKAAGTPEPERVPNELPLRPPSGGAVATEVGTTLGTPAYMSPEQAEGRWDLVGQASDIYGLGGTLYTLLTGRAPVEGDGPSEVLRKAARGESRPPCQVKGDVPPALDAVCRKAMAHDPRERYTAALELAADVEHWLADEPVRAWREPLRVRSGRWVRRHKPQVAAGMAALLVALVLGGAGLVWVERRAEERRRGVDAALQKAAEMQEQAHWAEARAVLDQAANRLADGGPADLRERLKRAQSELQLVERLDAIQLKRAAWLGDRFNDVGADREYATAFREAGLGAVGEDPEAVAARVRASGARQAVVDALDDWAVTLNRGARLAWVLAVARRADPDRWRDRVRQPKAWNDRARLARLAREASAWLAREAPAAGVSARFVGLLALRLDRVGGDAEELLRAAQGQRPADFWVNFALGHALGVKERMGEAVGFFRVALAVRPDAAGVRNNLGVALSAQGKPSEAEAEYRRATALDPNLAVAHYNLGNALKAQGDVAGAIAEYQKAIALEPKDPKPHNNLGLALKDQGVIAGAIAEYQKAIALDPKDAKTHQNLGSALYAQGKRGEALAEWRRAIALDPKLAPAHTDLANALRDQGQRGEALAEYRRAIALDPKDAQAHNGLGVALSDQGKPSEAEAEWRRAIALDPKLAPAHTNLGFALAAQGKLGEAEAAFRRTIALDPKNALAQSNLGMALAAQGKPSEAEAAFRRAIALDPKLAPAHGGLGEAFLALGRFAEARQATRACLRLLPAGHPQRSLAVRQLRQCERLLELDRKLAAVLRGQERPAAPAEQLEMAGLCVLKRRHAAAARFFADTFARQPNLATKLSAGHRYNAACSAALAGCGRGEDAAKLDDKQRARLRGQAREWLRADLTLRKNQVAGGKPAERQAAQGALRHWQTDPDLAGVRDKSALAKLPEAERPEWAKLWADVAALLVKAGPKK